MAATQQAIAAQAIGRHRFASPCPRVIGCTPGVPIGEFMIARVGHNLEKVYTAVPDHAPYSQEATSRGTPKDLAFLRRKTGDPSEYLRMTGGAQSRTVTLLRTPLRPPGLQLLDPQVPE